MHFNAFLADYISPSNFDKITYIVSKKVHSLYLSIFNFVKLTDILAILGIKDSVGDLLSDNYNIHNMF